MKALFLCPLLFVAYSLTAQTIGLQVKRKPQKLEKIELLKRSEHWNSGVAILTDESKLEGLFRYNQREDIISYTDGDEYKAFDAREVLQVSFFDEDLEKQRVFYSLPYSPDDELTKKSMFKTIESPDKMQNGKRFMFFEVLREYSSFAIFLRTSPITARAVQQMEPGIIISSTPGTTLPYSAVRELTSVDPPTNSGVPSDHEIQIQQTETIYFIDDAGNLKPYIEVHNFEDGHKNLFSAKDRKTRSKFVDEDVLSEYVTEPVYQKLKKYAKDNNLKFKKKIDFLKILAYYDTIVDNP